MKKILIFLTLILGISGSMYSRDSITRDESVLPQAAKATIAKNFKSKISLIKTEKTIGMIKEFEVILQDGSEICFDKNGNWTDIEVRRGKEIPSGFIPIGIRDYVKKNHSGQKIESLEKERNGYDVELSNGINMKFDKEGIFLRYSK